MSDQPENTPAAEAPEMSHEEAMARKHLESNPKDIPAQFGGDVDKFMDSWKEQRAALTRTQQELAEVKKSIHEAPTPGLEEQPPMAQPEAEVPESTMIPAPPETPPTDLWQDVQQELTSSGAVSDETRTRLAEAGIPGEVVEGYLKGMQAEQAAAAQKAANHVGGADTLNRIIEWAGKNLSAEEREAANAALSGPGWEFTLTGLKSRMEASSPTAAEPSSGPKVSGQLAPQVSAYRTQTEMTAAIRDPRYGVEAEYTDHVQNRIRATHR